MSLVCSLFVAYWLCNLIAAIAWCGTWKKFNRRVSVAEMRPLNWMKYTELFLFSHFVFWNAKKLIYQFYMLRRCLLRYNHFVRTEQIFAILRIVWFNFVHWKKFNLPRNLSIKFQLCNRFESSDFFVSAIID